MVVRGGDHLRVVGGDHRICFIFLFGCDGVLLYVRFLKESFEGAFALGPFDVRCCLITGPS